MRTEHSDTNTRLDTTEDPTQPAAHDDHTHTQAPETEHDHENRRAGSRTSYARSCEQN